MHKFFLFLLLVLGLILPCGCTTTYIHVVSDRDYTKLSYEERMKYLAKLYTANKLNKERTQKNTVYVVLE